MTSQQNRTFGLLAVLAPALVLAACLRPPEPPPPDTRFGRAERIRLLDGADEPVGHVRLRRRSVTASDEMGVRLGRATAVLGYVEASDRSAELIWRLEPEEGGMGEPDASRVRVLTGEGELRGRLEIDDDTVRLVNAQGYQLGEVRLTAEGTGEGSAGAAVYGAPGTDRRYLVSRAGRRTVDINNPSGERFVRLEGGDLSLRDAGAMTLPTPLAPGVEPTLAQERLFVSSLLLYLRVYGD